MIGLNFSLQDLLETFEEVLWDLLFVSVLFKWAGMEKRGVTLHTGPKV